MTVDRHLRDAVKARLKAGGWIDVAGHSPEDEWDAVAERVIEAVMGAAEVERLRRWEAIGRDLAASSPVHHTGWDEAYEECGLCEAGNRDANNRDIVLEHTECCPWRRARDLMDGLEQ